jgi:hypothetical protein
MRRVLTFFALGAVAVAVSLNVPLASARSMAPNISCSLSGGKNQLDWLVATSGWNAGGSGSVTITISPTYGSRTKTFSGSSTTFTGIINPAMAGTYTATATAVHSGQSSIQADCGSAYVCHSRCGLRPNAAMVARIRAKEIAWTG